MIGRTLSHYKVLEEQSRGGMGVVYRALDLKLDREVALKVLPPELVADPERKRRFVQEAKAAAKLNHPHIGMVFEIDDADGVTFIAMELIEGEQLKDIINKGRLPLARALELATEVAEGLVIAHEKGIVHRDLKPANILVTKQGHAKIIDFGLAKLVEPLAGESSDVETAIRGETDPGKVMGTVSYMSPEQARAQAVDHRSDVFSFGVVLHEFLSSRQPFHGPSSVETLNAILSKPAPRLPTLGSELSDEGAFDLQRILDKCMAKEPAERYQSVQELVVDLRVARRRMESSAPTARRRRRISPLAAVGYLVALVAAVAALYLGLRDRPTGRPSPASIESLAVLPLDNLSGDPEQEYFSDGMTETLITELSKIGNLKVISRTSAMRYKNTDKPLPEIAKELNVDAVVEGSVLRAGDQVRITAQLVHGATDRHIWADNYDRELRDILNLHSEVARAIAGEIKIQLTEEEETALSSNRPVNPEAHEAYLKGLYQLNLRSAEGFSRALDYFRQSTEIDPTYALGYSGLAEVYYRLGIGRAHPKEVMPKAKSAALKALELDDTLAESHKSMGSVLLWYDWDWPAAGRELKRAIELNPSYSDASLTYCIYLIIDGRFEEALAQARRAQELDPLSVSTNTEAANRLLILRQYDEAIEQYKKVLEWRPDSIGAYLHLVEVYYKKGLYDDAVEALKKLHMLMGQEEIADKVYASSGINGVLDESARQFADFSKKRYFSPAFIGGVYALANEKDKAIQWLETAYEQRDPLTIVLRDPMWDTLRSDPRFQEIVRRMNFPN